MSSATDPGMRRYSPADAGAFRPPVPPGLRREPSLWGLLPGIAAALVVVFGGGLYALAGLLNSEAPQAALTMLLSDPVVRASLGFSVRVAAISSISSILLGVMLALWLWKQPPAFPGYLYTLPLIFPHVVAAFFVIAWFSRSGLMSGLLYQLGIIQSLDGFPVLVFDNNGFGVILAYIYKETAFVVLLMLAAIRKIDSRLISTARMLGAGRTKRFFSVILPETGATLAVAWIIAFLYSFGAFDIPFLTGSASRPMASVAAYRLFFEGTLADRPRALALLVLIWLITMLFLIIFALMQQFPPRLLRRLNLFDGYASKRFASATRPADDSERKRK
jgi:putative spermidine/putrescine transport system permease protein